MNIEVQKTSVQKQITGIGKAFSIKDAYVVVNGFGKVENANGNLYDEATDSYAGSFNYAPASSSVQVNYITDIAAASQDVADFIAAVETAEVSNPTNIKA